MTLLFSPRCRSEIRYHLPPFGGRSAVMASRRGREGPAGFLRPLLRADRNEGAQLVVGEIPAEPSQDLGHLADPQPADVPEGRGGDVLIRTVLRGNPRDLSRDIDRVTTPRDDPTDSRVPLLPR